MGVTHLHELTQALLARGMARETPVAIIERGTMGDQKSVAGTLASIQQLARKDSIKPPAITVIGEVVKLRQKLNWFERRPLFNQRIVVTRTREQAGQLSRQLIELGAEVLEVPTIKLEPPTRRQDVVDAMLALNAYDWLVFTSPNGVA